MPSPRLRPARLALLAAALLSVTACGGGDADAAAEDGAVAAEGDGSSAPPAAAAAPTGMAADAPVAVADIERWERGLAAELKAVEEASEKLRTARTGEDTLTAMMSANETATRATGASAAGLDESRYGVVRSTLSEIVGAMAPLEAETDVTKMSAEMVKMLQDGRDQALARASEGVPAEVVEALRPRAAELRRQDLALVGARLKAAGIGG